MSSSIFGFSGALDVQGIVSQLLYVEQAPIRSLNSKISVYEQKIEAFNQLNSRLSELLASLQNLNDEDAFGAKTTTSSNDSVVKASADSSAAEGTYQIAVNRLALYDNHVSDSTFATADSTLGTGSFDLTVGSTTTTITIDSSNNTLEGLRKAIKDSGADVNAAIIHDGAGYRLTVTSKGSGATNAVSISNNTLTLADGSTPLTLSRTHDIADDSELDASLVVNGLAVTSSTNSVEGVIEGVTLQLLNADGSFATVNVANDTDTVKKNIESFVSSYNKLYSFINAQFSYTEGVGTGLLSGEFVLRDLQARLSQTISGSLSGLSGELTTLASAGVNMNNDGTLTIDPIKLEAAIKDNFDSIQGLFIALADSTHSQVSSVTTTSGTQPGTYSVSITTVAEAAEITAPNDTLTTLGTDETLTFTLKGKTSVVSLTSDMDLDTLIDVINSQLETDGLALTADRSGSKLVVTSNSKGDAVSFTVTSDIDGAGTGIGTAGMSDSGVSVEGTFTDVATGQVLATTGNGQYLKGVEGGATGLQIRFTGDTPGDYGSVSVTLGYAELLQRFLEDMTDSLEGPIHGAIDRYKSTINSLEDDIEAINLRLEQRERYLTQQFSRANEALQQMNYLQASLSAQLSQLSQLSLL